MAAKADCVYEVLSPWAEVDPVQLRSISARLDGLAGKKIGLLRNSKRAAEPSLKAVEDRLKKKYPTAEFTWFSNLTPNEALVELPEKQQWEDWLKGVDGVIASYGD